MTDFAAVAEGSPDRILFHSPIVRIGAFRCHPEHPSFHDTGPISDSCFVFPRNSVEIVHEHERPFVSNARTVTLYNRGQEYRRNPISRDGDRCDWFGVDDDIVLEVVRAFDPAAESRPESPYRFARSWSDHALYLAQREVFEWVAREEGKWSAGAARVEPFEIEERVIQLLEQVVRNMYAGETGPPSPAGAHAREVVHHVEILLSESWQRPLGLPELAKQVNTSVFHLCRMFRRVTGTTLHQYRHALRVRATLEAVRESKRPLSRIAIDAGFASHSHFTTAFQGAFGQSPSRARRTAQVGIEARF